MTKENLWENDNFTSIKHKCSICEWALTQNRTEIGREHVYKNTALGKDKRAAIISCGHALPGTTQV